MPVGWGILERFWNFLKKLGNWKGTGKDRDPILNKRKGKERFPFFCLEDRKGPHSRKNGQVNMYGIVVELWKKVFVTCIFLDSRFFPALCP